MNISIKTIPHKEQRYDTCGDWWFTEEGDLEIRVSDLGNWKYEATIAHHEEREALHCKSLGITEEEVTDFDIRFEQLRTEESIDEPGDSIHAPYHYPHVFATREERVFLDDLGENWEEYEEHVTSL